jgi:hypothetical protein
MSASLNLYRLQQIDTQLDHTTQQMAEIESLLADDSLVRDSEAQRNAALSELTKGKILLQQAEYNVQEQKIKIQQTEAALYGGKVRNPKELQDLQHESASLSKYLVTLEDRLLDAMLSVEEQEAEASAKQQEYLQVIASTQQKHAGWQGEASRLSQLRERLIIERQAAENAIPENDLAVYQQLRKTRSGLAVAKIIDRTCAACGAALTPALVQAANSPNQFARCASCGRILYPG